MQQANNPALGALKDIHTPAEIGAWPLAYGYWLALAAVLILLITSLIWLIKRHKHLAAKRQALQAIKQLDLNHPQFAIEINAIVKRAAMSYLPRGEIASLDGDAWYRWLVDRAPSTDQRLCQLLAKRYQAQALTLTEAELLKALTSNWMKQALPLKTSNKEQSCSH
ncbi:DUF4381 domain-containing protein [Shewanella sp. AS1]|uniref:DUF4381 domain-containing protein n=1 Tax=Shewanella sp. AS1 TaxID=2907626 RepID=UPI001F1C9E6D|nr:DUF4381 domain-containing protein [Shewanella sp. AS1]MCE9679532.1 DUF4381 domain-containing protein [Shewanella sp. AS1]